MRRLVLLAVCGLLLISFGCKSEPPPDPKKMPPRRMLKPGDKGGDAPPVPIKPTTP